MNEHHELEALRPPTGHYWAIAVAVVLLAVAIGGIAVALHEQTAMCYGTWEEVE